MVAKFIYFLKRFDILKHFWAFVELSISLKKRAFRAITPLSVKDYIERVANRKEVNEIMELLEIWIIEMGILAFGLGFSALSFIYKSYKKIALKTVSQYYFGLGVFFLAFAFNGILDALEQYYLWIVGQNGIFPAWNLLPGESVTFYLMIPILQFAFVMLSLQIETFILQRPKKNITKVLIVCFIISLTIFITPVFPDTLKVVWSLVLNATLIPYAIIVLYWGVFYLRLGAKSAGAVRSKALKVGFGLGMIMTGIVFDTIYRNTAINNSLEIMWWFPIIFKTVAIIGIPLLYSGLQPSDSE